MFEKVLVAVDGSEASDAAVDAAISLARKCGAEVDVMHVELDDFTPAWEGLAPRLETPEEAASLIERTVRRVSAAGCAAHGTLARAERTQVADVITDHVRSSGIDLIVVGTRGRSTLAGLVLGSVPHKLIHLGGGPVLVVGEAYAAAAPEERTAMAALA